jgi:hypothetical protein
MALERRYDLKNYTLPANCRGCRFNAVVDRSVVRMDCPVHGIKNLEPVGGPPNWPALISVDVED